MRYSRLAEKLLGLAKAENALQESTGTTGIAKTINNVAHELTRGEIPHLIAGGAAVQRYGYPRMTVDVDVIVPSVETAKDYLSIHGFAEKPGSSMTVVDRETKVDVDLMPAGKNFTASSKVPLPTPAKISREPQYISLPDLISIKLDSWLQNRERRAKDMADVAELIQRLDLPRAFKAHPETQAEYLRIWDEINAD